MVERPPLASNAGDTSPGFGKAPGPASARCPSVVARSSRLVHIAKDEDERSPPVLHMLATVAFGEPGAVEECIA